jgi:hypothetical protein
VVQRRMIRALSRWISSEVIYIGRYQGIVAEPMRFDRSYWDFWG